MRPAQRVSIRITLIVALLVPACTPSPPEQGIDNTLTDVFVNVAFGRELGASQNAVLHKWDQPVRLATEGIWKIDPWAVLEPHRVVLSELSGLEISRADAESANILVLALPSAEFPSVIADFGIPPGPSSRLLARATCFFIFEPNRTQAIVKAVVVIDRNLPAVRIRHCLVEEVTQALGLPNDIVSRQPTLFDDAQMLTELSALDRDLLRLLYHPALRAGMDRARVYSLAQAIAGTNPAGSLD